MKQLLFFSNNRSKIKEIRNIFQNTGIEIKYPNQLKVNFSPLEDGRTFAENAKIKSMYGYRNTKIPCFADDSGICIEALNWKPGVTSKDFLENFENSKDCFKYIFSKIKKTKKNKAYFKTSICLTLHDNYHIVFEGIVNGIISNRIRGEKGFGYDPIFIPHNLTKTFAEIGLNKKNTISHRSNAINKLVSFLVN